jgi:hypothetical protein
MAGFRVLALDERVQGAAGLVRIPLVALEADESARERFPDAVQLNDPLAQLVELIDYGEAHPITTPSDGSDRRPLGCGLRPHTLHKPPAQRFGQSPKGSGPPDLSGPIQAPQPFAQSVVG